MQKKRWLWLLLAVAVLGAAVVVVCNSVKEPEYEGKKLSEWVGVYATPGALVAAEERKGATNAIQHIGTNAIPYLLEWVMYETPAWRTNLSARIDPLLARLKHSWQLKYDSRLVRVLAARRAFSALGSAGQVAVPRLDAILKDRDGPINRRMRAAFVLPELAQAGFGSLLSAVKRQQFPPEFAAGMYDTPETKAPSLVSYLREAVQSQDATERELAMRVLERFPPEALEKP